MVVPLVVLAELEAKRHHPELGWAARQALRALEDLRTDLRHAGPAPAGQRAGRHRAGRGQPPGAGRPARHAAVRGQRPPHPRRGPQPGQRGRRGRGRHQGPPAAAQGQHRRAGRRRVPQRAGHRQQLGGLRRARRGGGRHRRAVRRAVPSTSTASTARGLRPAVPHGPGPPRRIPVGPRPRPPGQAGAPRAQRQRGVRRPRPLGRAAHRHRPAQRPVHRDRQPRRERRDRQERPGARRRPRGGAGGPHPPAGHRLPPALLRRRTGPRLPARAPRRRRWARGRPR